MSIEQAEAQTRPDQTGQQRTSLNNVSRGGCDAVGDGTVSFIHPLPLLPHSTPFNPIITIIFLLLKRPRRSRLPKTKRNDDDDPEL